VSSGLNSCLTYGGIGWDDPWCWQPGTYRVEILINGDKFTEGSFTIKEARRGLALGLVSLKFFESAGKGLAAKEQRQYSTTFSQSTACLINYELTVKDLRPGGEKRYQVEVRYISPAGSIINTRSYENIVPSGLWGWDVASGTGWDEPGHWTPGTYRLEILIDGVKFADESFTIE
jgi:hypothetical protein